MRVQHGLERVRPPPGRRPRLFWRGAGRGGHSSFGHDDCPQQRLAAAFVVMLETPACGLSVYSWVPVLKKSWPAWLVGFWPFFANFAIASTPSTAILPGNCPAVAPISPSATNGRLLHPPSMATIVTPV